MAIVRRGIKVNQGSAAAKHAKDWHWGVEAKQVVDWRDPDVDRNLKSREVIEIGRFVEVKVRPIGDRALVTIPVPKRYVEQCHVVFDRGHKYQRIYLLTVDPVNKVLRGLWNESESIDLRDYAEQIGSKHGTRDYPALAVVPLGRAVDVVYKTNKGRYSEWDEPDGLSQYIHRLGEDGGVQPGLAVDSIGRLWFAGGSYSAPRPGITQ